MFAFKKSFILCVVLSIVFALAMVTNTLAGSATWKSSPSSGEWGAASNWTPATVPNGSSDVATFGASTITNVLLPISPAIVVGDILFQSTASAFRVEGKGRLDFTGTGVINNSNKVQEFVFNAGVLIFTNSATAGNLSHFTMNSVYMHRRIDSGLTIFEDSSTAGNATLTVNAGNLQFEGNSTAANATILNIGDFGAQAATLFLDNSTAGNASLFVNNNGENTNYLEFYGNSSGGTARIVFTNGSADGYAAEVNGTLTLYSHAAPGLTVGSIEGLGKIVLNSDIPGSNNLTVGSNGESTTFSGVILDTGVYFYNPDTGQYEPVETRGSLNKIGIGILGLTGASTYTGGTFINGGAIWADNTTGSATGTGAVKVNVGTLRGNGRVVGPVTVGTGTTSPAMLIGGDTTAAPGTLTIDKSVTFKALSTYRCILNRSTLKASKVSALGVVIRSNSKFVFFDSSTVALAKGKAFKVINNTSTSPISGTFSNLPNGSTFTSNGTTFKANYFGGTGNDLILTVQ